MLAFMAVSVTVLASGSKGNCTLVASSGTRLLVDAGLSCRELLRRLALCGGESTAASTPFSSRTNTATTSAGCGCWPSG